MVLLALAVGSAHGVTPRRLDLDGVQERPKRLSEGPAGKRSRELAWLWKAACPWLREVAPGTSFYILNWLPHHFLWELGGRLCLLLPVPGCSEPLHLPTQEALLGAGWLDGLGFLYLRLVYF